MCLRVRIPVLFGLNLIASLMLMAQASPPPQDKPAATAAPHAMGTRQKVKGIGNFGQVSDSLYRGALPSAEGLKTLKSMGVDIVVDMRHGQDPDEEKQVKQLGMQYVAIPSWCPFPKDEPMARFLKVIEENRGKKVFVHCRLGDDRTGIAVASYRMAEQGWTAQEAMKEMKAFGFSTAHHALCPGLAGYAESFPERLKKNPAFRDLSAQRGQQ